MIDWTPELEDQIAEQLESRSLLTVCAENPELPSRASINRRLNESKEFETKCARARQDHALFILEDVQKEILTAQTKEQAYVANVKASHAQWYVTKLLPKLFGDRIQNEHTGENGGPIQIVSTIPRPPKE